MRPGPFGSAMMRVLASAGMAREMVTAEYGRDRYELTIAPAEAQAAADRSVILRAAVRDQARLLGRRASFAPKSAIEGVGSGLHSHVSLTDTEGQPVSYDPAAAGSVSAGARAFVAGILRHLPALTALTAPGPTSYLRLEPQNWSSGYTWFGERDREASLRICPVARIGGADPARAFNIAYRPADATACPHLAPAVLLRAGLEGLGLGLPTPPLVAGDPAALTDAERRRLGLVRLPQSLGEALRGRESDATVTGGSGPRAIETHLGMNRAELSRAGDVLDDAPCARCAAIY
jgi:glutamine synthetase